MSSNLLLGGGGVVVLVCNWNGSCPPVCIGDLFLECRHHDLIPRCYLNLLPFADFDRYCDFFDYLNYILLLSLSCVFGFIF